MFFIIILFLYVCGNAVVFVRYQLKCSELEKQKKLFDFQYEALEAEKKDITDYLKRSLLEKEDEVEELLERLESLRQATDQERDSLQLKQDQMRQEHQEEIVELTRENRKLGETLTFELFCGRL